MTRPRSVFVLAAGCALVAGLVRAQSGPGSARPAASLARWADLVIAVEDDRVSVTARGVPRQAVLEAVAERAGLALELDGRFDQPVSLAFARLPLRDALRRLIGSDGFVLRRAAPSSGGPVRGRLWVVAGGRGSPEAGRTPGSRLDPRRHAMAEGDARTRLRAIAELVETVADGAPVAGTPAAELLTATALFDEAASVRAEAVHGLGERADPDALATLERALADPDRRVRSAAIDALGDLGDGLDSDDAVWALATALDDADPQLREQAADTLGDLGGAIAAEVLQRALGDERAAVRQAAAEALDARPAEPDG